MALHRRTDARRLQANDDSFSALERGRNQTLSESAYPIAFRHRQKRGMIPVKTTRNAAYRSDHVIAG